MNQENLYERICLLRLALDEAIAQKSAEKSIRCNDVLIISKKLDDLIEEYTKHSLDKKKDTEPL